MRKLLILPFIVTFLLTGCSSSKVSYSPKFQDPISFGNLDSSIQITEFADYKCPACQSFTFSLFDKIKTEFADSGRVRYTFIDFPLRSIHPQAQGLAETTYCAADQGDQVPDVDKFLAYQYELFNLQGKDLRSSDFLDIAKKLGLNEEQFKNCIDSKAYKFLVDNGYNMANKLGLGGTPTILINNIQVPFYNNIDHINILVSALEKPIRQQFALEQAFKQILVDILPIYFKNVAPNVDYDFTKIDIGSDLVNKFVSSVDVFGSPIYSFDNAVATILTGVQQELLKR